MRKPPTIIKAAIVIVFLMSAVIVFSSSRKDEKSILFDHGLHVVDNEMTCDDCHEAVKISLAGQRSIPDHDVCSGCHEVDGENECGTCHLDTANPTAIPDRGEYYTGFSHKPHTDKDLTCETCHNKISTVGISPSIPVMSDCQDCHAQRNASLDCEVCHQGKRPKPLDHMLVSWSQDHGLDASAGVSDCAACHEQISCDDCHQGLNLFGKPHPPTWLFNHFAESSFGGECMVCHETREYCTKCHRTSIPTPHTFGPSFANNIDGGSHKDEAEAFIEVCISCHDVGENDPTCAKCHK